MLTAHKLPTFLVNRYRAWLATTYAENKSWHVHLAERGQHPRTMIIACCDSRVHVEALFTADAGEFFTYRNIANLVPPSKPGGDAFGTAAAVEYAVTVLHVAHLIVMGHSQCGGIRGCHDMCIDDSDDLASRSAYIGRWLGHLRPAFEKVRDLPDTESRVAALEHEGIRVSLANLMTFPFVREAVEAGSLTLHGLWKNIGEGRLEYLDGESGRFLPV